MGSPLLNFERRVLDEELTVGGQSLTLEVPAIGPAHEALYVVMDDELLAAVAKAAPEIANAVAAGVSIKEEHGKLTAHHIIGLLLHHSDAALGFTKGAAIPILKEKAGMVAIICLDSMSNRRALAADPEWVAEFGDPMVVEEVPNVRIALRSPAFRRWASQAIDYDQAVLIAAEVKGLIQWGAMGEAIGAMIRTAISAPVTPKNGVMETAQTTIPSQPSEASSLPA